jgi:hypothetical protein
VPRPSSVSAAHDQLQAARTTSAARLYDLASAREQLRDLQRHKAPTDQAISEADAAVENARQALLQARSQERSRKGDLQSALSTWFAARFPRDDIGEIRELTTRFPIVLLPVEIQTRFDPPGAPTQLLVRIYPDTILNESHDAALSAAEREAGEAYWTAGWDPTDEPEAWRALLRRLPAARAAWVVRQTAPTNLGDGRPEEEPKFVRARGVILRPGGWTGPAEARLLPDRWLVVAFRGGAEVHRGLSKTIRLPLSMSPDPAEEDPTQIIDVSGDGLLLDAEMQWLVDFSAAEKTGMGVRINLGPVDVRDGFDELIVVGVKASLTPARAARRLGDLLSAHRYSRGFALVPQGTPTNNTSDRPSGFPPEDLGGRASFALEREGLELRAGSDGLRLAAAFGLGERADRQPSWTETELPHVGAADGWDQRSARAMSVALWPILRYYLEQMLAPVFDRQAIESVGGYVRDYVRGRGPYPAIRVGETPYGVLPTSALDSWSVAPGARSPALELPKVLSALRKRWRAATPALTQIGGGRDPDEALLNVLSMDASAQEVRLRGVWGADLIGNLFRFAGTDFFGLDAAAVSSWIGDRLAAEAGVKSILSSAGWQGDPPRVAHAALKPGAFRFRYPFVTAEQLSDSQSLGDTADPEANYIAWIQQVPPQLLANPLKLEEPPLLLLLLRHATLLEYLSRAFDILGLAAQQRREPELIGVPLDTGQTLPPVWDHLSSTVRPPNLGEYLNRAQNAETRGMDAYRENLALLRTLPTGELEHLLTETLDTWSHRIDAWITSLSTERLVQMRAAEPTGCHLGAFGWIENLRRTPRRQISTRKLPDGRTVHVQSGNGGYIHGPSMTHAATAAVLRSGYMNRAGEPKQTFALDLSSGRVRAALALLDAVREGQHFGSVLGYRIERAMHERSTAGLNLERFIAPLRRHYPLVANKGDAKAGPASDLEAARNVVDGLALWRDWKKRKGLPAALALPSAEAGAIDAILGTIDGSLDAVADLLVAESVHQMVRGNTTAAGADLEAMAAGSRPPEPDVAATPRGGATLSHRFLLVLGDGATPSLAGWTTTKTPRANAEPRLDEWVGWVLGDPTKATCRVTYPRNRPLSQRTQKMVALSDLGLRPLDVLALAAVAADTGQASELDRRIADVVIVTAAAPKPAPDDVEITYSVQLADRLTERSLSDVLELGRTLSRSLGGARPLRPGDLQPPARAVDRPIFEADATSRATVAKDAFEAAVNSVTAAIASVRTAIDSNAVLQLANLLQALRALALFGVPGAFPGPRQAAALLAQAESVAREAQRRLAAAKARPTTDPSGIVADIFGPSFTFLPRFRVAESERDELGLALAADNGLTSAGDEVITKWFHQAARVRQPLARWRRLALCAASLGVDALKLAVAQLPHADGARWAALPFFTASPPVSGRVSLVMQRFASPTPDGVWAGLLIDEWSEVIPRAAEETGLAFHYDDPGAEAPHSVLIAVPPDLSTPSWTSTTLLSVVRETLELARIRAVEAETLDGLGQLLPGIYTAANESADTAEIPFAQGNWWTGDLTS